MWWEENRGEWGSGGAAPWSQADGSVTASVLLKSQLHRKITNRSPRVPPASPRKRTPQTRGWPSWHRLHRNGQHQGTLGSRARHHAWNRVLLPGHVTSPASPPRPTGEEPAPNVQVFSQHLCREPGWASRCANRIAPAGHPQDVWTAADSDPSPPTMRPVPDSRSGLLDMGLQRTGCGFCRPEHSHCRVSTPHASPWAGAGAACESGSDSRTKGHSFLTRCVPLCFPWRVVVKPHWQMHTHNS